MDNPPTSDGNAPAPTNGPVAEQPKPLPYRWGYFQGATLIPFALLVMLGTAEELQRPSHYYPWYLSAIQVLMGFIALPLALGLLRKKAFALHLVYAMFGLSVLQLLVKLPMAIHYFADSGDRGSAFFEAEWLLLWLLSLVYYRKRRLQFR